MIEGAGSAWVLSRKLSPSLAKPLSLWSSAAPKVLVGSPWPRGSPPPHLHPLLPLTSSCYPLRWRNCLCPHRVRSPAFSYLNVWGCFLTSRDFPPHLTLVGSSWAYVSEYFVQGRTGRKQRKQANIIEPLLFTKSKLLIHFLA